MSAILVTWRFAVGKNVLVDYGLGLNIGPAKPSCLTDLPPSGSRPSLAAQKENYDEGRGDFRAAGPDLHQL